MAVCGSVYLPSAFCFNTLIVAALAVDVALVCVFDLDGDISTSVLVNVELWVAAVGAAMSESSSVELGETVSFSTAFGVVQTFVFLHSWQCGT